MFGPFKKPSRLNQWDGRRRSSRSDEPVLARLRQPSAWHRLGMVLLTALFATLLAFYFGPVQAYRMGEISQHDLLARVYFEVVNQAQTESARDQAVADLPPEAANDPQAYEQAREATPAV